MQQVRQSSTHTYGPLFLEDDHVYLDEKRMVYQYAGEGDAEDNYKYDNDKISEKERDDQEEEPSVYKDWNTRFQVCALSSHLNRTPLNANQKGTSRPDERLGSL